MLLLLLIPLILFIILSPLGIAIQYKRDTKKDNLSILLTLFWGLIKFKLKAPGGAKKKAGRANYSGLKISNLRVLLQELNKIKQLFRHKIVCTEYRAVISFSLGDASKTGMVAGILWSLAGFSGRLKYYITYKCRPKIVITPSYDENFFIEVDFSKKIHFRVYLLFYLLPAVARAILSSLFAGIKERNKAILNTTKGD